MSANHSLELQEIKALLMEQRNMIELLFPNEVELSFVVEKTGLSRQTVRNRLINNFEVEEDFWKRGGKIFMSRKTALQFLNKKRRGENNE